MSKMLIRFEGNWADEMELFGFEIMEEEVWRAHLKRVRKFLEDGGPYEKCVGSNENIEYTNYDEYVSHFTGSRLTDMESQTIEKFFPPYRRGAFHAIRREEMWEHPTPENDNQDLEY